MKTKLPQTLKIRVCATNYKIPLAALASETNLSILRGGTCFLVIIFCLAGLAHSQQMPSTTQAAKAILEQHCIACHGASEMSGLDMRQRDTLLKGGRRGQALVPGKAEQSLLYLAAAHQGELKMPPGSQS